MKLGTIVSVILSLNVIDEINTQNTCKCDIITKFYKMYPQLKYTPITLNALGLVTYYSVPKGVTVSDFKCAMTYVNTSSNKSAEVHTTINFYNTLDSSNHSYKLHNVGRGHVVERGINNDAYRLYFINVPGIACVYRCVDGEVKDGTDFATIAVPIYKQDQPEVLEAVAECKKKLKAVGITEPLVDITTCRPPEY
uniref:Lipocalin/cytosolic fatty-acid binding domain-containing protein n=1 Tax=Graphocephala atropunctata TaxID=36148 RepID=A0A1B6MUE7_9HEMI